MGSLLSNTQLQAAFNITTMKKPHFMIMVICLSCDVVSIHAGQGMDKVLVVGCSVLHYDPNSIYEYNLKSLFTSLLNSATLSSYNNFTIEAASPPGTITGLYQCRADLSLPDCATCVSHTLTQMPACCPSASGASLHLDACYVKYDNSTFLGVQDKRVSLKKCGTPIDADVETMTQWDSMLGALVESSSGAYRVGEAGRFKGVAQCVGDLSDSQCQDCVAEAVGRLKAVCGTADFGDMFLDKCYARYSTHDLPQFSIDPQHEKHKDASRWDEYCRKIEKAGIGVVGGVFGLAAITVVINLTLTKQTAHEISSAHTIQIEGYIPYEVDINLTILSQEQQRQQQQQQEQEQEQQQEQQQEQLVQVLVYPYGDY